MDDNPIYSPPLPQSQSPMLPKLSPLPFGRVVALTQTIYRKRFTAYFIPAALTLVPISLITSILSGTLIDQSQAMSAESQLLQRSSRSTTTLSQTQLEALTRDSLKLLSAALVVIAISVILQLIRLVLVDSVLIYLTSEHVLGRHPTFGEAFSATRSRWGAVVLGQCGLYAMLFGLFVVLAFTLFLCGLGFGLLVYIGLALGALLTPVLVLERVGVFQGLSHTWGLGKGRFWAIIGMVGITVLLGVAIGIPIGFVNALLPNLFGTDSSGLPVLIVSGLLTGLSGAFIAPIGLIGYTVLYYDARVRLEQFGESLAALNNPEAKPSDIQPPTGLNLGGIKGSDFINIALVTAGTFVFILIYVALAFSLPSVFK